MTPQIILTLAPSGQIIAELPGASGSRRQIQLSAKPEEALATLQRILQEQLLNAIELGLDGAPTQAQVRHWEKHHLWSDPSCRFCIAEGRFDTVKPQRRSRGILLSKHAGVEVRRIPSRKSGRKQGKELLQSVEVFEDLGL